MISSPSGGSASPNGSTRPSRPFCRRKGEDAVRLLVVGLAPGLRGANRTGRPFTGDYAGDLLYSTLIRFGFARGEFKARPDDGLELIGTAITNAVRCVPPRTSRPARRFPPAGPSLRRRLPASRSSTPCSRSAPSPTSRPCGRWVAASRPIRSSTARPSDRRRDAFFQLSLLALQHQHRRSDARDVCRRIQADRGVPEKLTPVVCSRHASDGPENSLTASPRRLTIQRWRSADRGSRNAPSHSPVAGSSP